MLSPAGAGDGDIQCVFNNKRASTGALRFRQA